MPITYTNTFADGETLTHTKLNDNFTDISDKFNGGIVDGDIANDASISVTKLASSRFSEYVNMFIYTGVLAAGWPAAGTICVAPLPGPNGTWAVDEVLWSCTDVGGAAGDFQIQYGHMAAGAFVSAGNVTTSTVIAAAGAGAATVSTSTLTKDSNTDVLALVATGVDAACLAGGNNFDCLHIMIRLTRSLNT